jgi:hypothetical protein
MFFVLDMLHYMRRPAAMFVDHVVSVSAEGFANRVEEEYHWTRRYIWMRGKDHRARVIGSVC